MEISVFSKASERRVFRDEDVRERLGRGGAEGMVIKSWLSYKASWISI